PATADPWIPQPMGLGQKYAKIRFHRDSAGSSIHYPLAVRWHAWAYARPVAGNGEGSGRVLTHVDASGAARMVDVAGKEVTVRRAVATGSVRTTTEVIDLLRRDGLPKGDAL